MRSFSINLGRHCSINKERGGTCTGYDGTIAQDILIKKNFNAWNALHSVIELGVWCDSCKHDGLKGLGAWHDVVNITIGETNRAHNPKNLLQFQKRVNQAVEACTNCHVGEPL